MPPNNEERSDDPMTMPDFSRAREKPLQFTIDGDVFDAVAVLPAGATRALIAMTAGDENDGVTKIEKMGEFMDIVLLPASAVLFAARMKDPVRPIDDEQIGEVCMWLVEQYGSRPTMPPTPSDGGRRIIGTTSTDGAQPPALV